MNPDKPDLFYSWLGRIVFVSNIPFHLKAQEVMLLMRQFGRCFRVDLARNEAGKSRGFCFAEYEKKESAELAAKYLDGAQLEDRFLRAEISKRPPDQLVDIYKATARQRAERDRQIKLEEQKEEPKKEKKEKKTKEKKETKEKKDKKKKDKEKKPRKKSRRSRRRQSSSSSSSDYSYSYSDSGYSYSYSYSYSDSGSGSGYSYSYSYSSD